MNPSIKAVKYGSPWHLVITFNNGETRVFDFSGYLQYPVYEPLPDESFCRKVKVCNGTLAWHDTVDFDPDTLYLESKQLVEA